MVSVALIRVSDASLYLVINIAILSVCLCLVDRTPRFFFGHRDSYLQSVHIIYLRFLLVREISFWAS